MRKMLVLLAGLAACGPAADAAPPRAAAVDSVFGPEESLRRLRVGLREPPSLSGGAGSAAALVEGFVSALERGDTAAAVGMHLTRAEFAWLYFPTTATPAAGTRMDPRLMWTLMRLESEKGLDRLFTRFGGEPLGYRGLTCEPEPRAEGANRLWEHCRVALDRAPGGTRLFGTLIERDGHFKFVSFKTDL